MPALARDIRLGPSPRPAAYLAIEVDSLVRRRGSVEAVRGISFSVQPGEIFGLLGPNGAGKTSTIEVLEGLARFTSGTVRVLGHAIPDDAPKVKERIGVQLQVTGLPRYLRVGETIDLFRSFYASPVSDTSSIVERLGLTPFLRRVNSRLSGGERQRVALALALVNDPDILFLDEPSSGLDPHARRELWTIIREWQSGGKTVFLTTHDMHEAEALCDRVAIMDHGLIVAQGSVPSLISEAGSEQAIWLETDPASIGADLEALLTVPMPNSTARPPLLRQDDGIIIYSADPMATMERLLDLRRGGRIAFASVQLRTPSLEDAFLALTGHRLGEA